MEIDIKKVAKLARLKIEEKDLERVTKEVFDLIKSVENLPVMEDEGALLNENDIMDLREDKAEKLYNRNDMLKNAPKIQAGCIVAPKNLE